MTDDLFITQTEDIDIELTVLQPSGAVLPMASAISIYVIVYDGYKNVWDKFTAYNAAGAWKQLDITMANSGILKFKILTTISKTMTPGRYYCEVRVRFNSTVHTDDFLQDVVETEQYLFSILESQINKITPLP